MREHLDIDIRAYCHKHDCNISYRLNDFECSKPEVIADIIKTIRKQIEQHIDMKERQHAIS